MKFTVSFLLLISLASAKSKHVLSGSHESMIKQNQEITNLKLPRIVDDNQLNQLVNQNELVRIPENGSIITSNLTGNRRYVRPWVRNFLLRMGNSFYSDNHQPIVIDSAVRTVEQQSELIKINKFAAPAYGELPSSHLAGITVDIAKRRYTPKQRKWIVNYLKSLHNQGYIIATEEPYCYHVAVLEKYNEVNQ